LELQHAGRLSRSLELASRSLKLFSRSLKLPSVPPQWLAKSHTTFERLSRSVELASAPMALSSCLAAATGVVLAA
jgi:hypothetical protein